MLLKVAKKNPEKYSIYDLSTLMLTLLSGKERRRRMVVVGRDGVEVRRMDKIRRAVGLEGQSII